MTFLLQLLTVYICDYVLAVQASIAANTFVVSGPSNVKSMLPILLSPCQALVAHLMLTSKHVAAASHDFCSWVLQACAQPHK